MTDEERAILRQMVEALAASGQATAALANAVVLFESGAATEANLRIKDVAAHLTELTTVGRALVGVLE